MKKNVDNISSVDIENAIASAGDKFTVDELIRTLAPGDADALRRRLERFIASDDTIFYDEKWNCCTRKSFFNGKKFIITPDDWEISNGILFPGHRFVPFIADGVFPSTVELNISGEKTGMKKFISPLGSCFHYHILLGSEQIFDFLLADDPANESLKHHAGKTDSVTLTVYDLTDFYRKHEFLFGDAIVCTVEDHEAGIISAEYLSGSLRGSHARKEYLAVMDDAAAKVWQEFQDYPDIPEQLAWMVYYSGVTEVPGASIDEFIAASEKVQLRPEGDHAVLTVADEHDHCHDDHCSCHGHDHDDDDECGMDIPEGLSISSAELSDPFKLLAHAGVPLSATELDGFILDAIYGRETDFSGVQSRIFGSSAIDLPDEAQQAVLLNFLEERFETMMENYNRADDEPKAELRSQIMEAVSRRMDYLAYLGSTGRDPNEAEKKNMHHLADVAAKLGEALKLLNHPGFTPDHQERENLEILIDDQLSIQEEILADFSSEADQ
ncbi:MAG: hypothetical protein E7058_01975 [Lentisphaerae bacterium]|nr:hypothetical protein [Lentisphaerota bacterium]